MRLIDADAMCGLMFMIGMIAESAQLLIASVVLAIVAQMVKKE